MAAVCRLSSRFLVLSKNSVHIRNFSNYRNLNSARQNNVKLFSIIGGGVAAFVCANLLKTNTVHASSMSKIERMRKREDDKTIKLTPRERRFIKFASAEYNGQLYMTPQDFLDSVVEQEPRPRLKRRSIMTNDLNRIKDTTPALKKGSARMFRTLRDNGIISYTEYLFLLSVLTKPISGFRIAFNMFDTDGNQRVDKKEFLVLKHIFGGSFNERNLDEDTRQVMERIFSGAWKDKRGQTNDTKDKTNDDDTENDNDNDNESKKPEQDEKLNKEKQKKHAKDNVEDDYIDDEEGLQRKHKVDTTLQVHFFGKKGNNDLYYDGFYKFMDNLQTEVLELEFSEFSKGNIQISELDFAKILLRYTYLAADEYDKFLDRLLSRIKDEEQGITFEEFRDFCRFLNNLDDFAIAMRMYTLADRAISKNDFSRAVKICTGFTLSKHLIDTVFAIFDEDGDGLLSYKEFIAIMKDRLHRGLKSTTKAEGWDAFKICVKQDIRASRSAR
ncbi:calcium uptake protein 3, mitochondrial-like isoform X2 [Teleopsis dalmanni]|uniref:calcium uptake protein 3, mitochondrial isoform X2 n=1 Tax=Teleopsis dalmanni TaxID=139649 RepID=UPI0018CE21B5|nr:calcium uptake protein 3, mitochondrial isoform X2 [Teleopsis dalmanni]XP_037944944.1 calcium uptake protein 3, mitochondrial-like isoform X2 [Teleopsis dalmanni]